MAAVGDILEIHFQNLPAQIPQPLTNALFANPTNIPPTDALFTNILPVVMPY